MGIPARRISPTRFIGQFIGLFAVLALACAGPQGAAPPDGFAEWVETRPVETSLGSSDLPETHVEWLELLEGAQRRVDLAHFYASDSPDAALAPTRLGPITDALVRAARRGVEVRFLLAETFRETYPDLAAQLDAEPGIDVRFLDLRPVTGGVMHTKWMSVDGERAYIGSANYDWRALEHIQELGILVESAALVQPLTAVFELDWAIAGGAEPAAARALAGAVPGGSVALRSPYGEMTQATFVASPANLLPEGQEHDLPALVAALSGAKESIQLQLLTYRLANRDGTAYDTLQAPLLAAAARGVRVQLLVADWGKRPGTVDGLKALARVPNVEVRFVNIPVASTGFVPFARVAHAKCLVVDGATAWIGTSNWEASYFESGRNVGLLLEGGGLPTRLATWFEANWDSPYTETVDPDADYTAPRRE